MATSVAAAVGNVADEWVERLAPRVRSLRIDGGMEPDLDMGPLISAAHSSQLEGERNGKNDRDQDKRRHRR
jgi:malonate-semialdehyde dehydrogenase (acetylating)/methylmalonate-semialdehyde dehydrogenase